jgi:tRNA modification GTPase
MLDDGNVGLKIKNGIDISIIGRPNVGKSSLLNFLARDDIAIVSDRAGTTRDLLRVSREISGIPVTFFDTAGLGETTDEVETEGIRRALANADDADFRLVILEPGNYGIDPRIASLVDRDTIFILNKIDLLDNDPEGPKILELIESEYPGITKISLKQGKNCKNLLYRLEDLIDKKVTPFLNTNITRERHRGELKSALSSLKKISMMDTSLEITLEYIRQASLHLGRIMGKIDVEEILDNIFEKFCIGK